MSRYLTIEELLAEDAELLAVPAPAPVATLPFLAVPSAGDGATEGGLIIPAGVDAAAILPESVQELLGRRDTLRHHLDVLSGKAPSPDADPAFLARYPIHRRTETVDTPKLRATERRKRLAPLGLTDLPTRLPRSGNGTSTAGVDSEPERNRDEIAENPTKRARKGSNPQPARRLPADEYRSPVREATPRIPTRRTVPVRSLANEDQRRDNRPEKQKKVFELTKRPDEPAQRPAALSVRKRGAEDASHVSRMRREERIPPRATTASRATRPPQLSLDAAIPPSIRRAASVRAEPTFPIDPPAARAERSDRPERLALVAKPLAHSEAEPTPVKTPSAPPRARLRLEWPVAIPRHERETVQRADPDIALASRLPVTNAPVRNQRDESSSVDRAASGISRRRDAAREQEADSRRQQLAALRRAGRIE